MDVIFSVENIFNTNNGDGALYLHSAKNYYIAPYQRGYKWSANHPNDPVCLLLKDLLDASKSLSSEYYLQFITTRLTENKGKKVLEVIDGQQRLTTLTLILSVFASIKGNDCEAISNNLLSYEVRPIVTDFFDTHIYSNLSNILNKTWEDFIVEFEDYNEQDIYYLFSAANKINKIISEEFKEDKEGFYAFEKYVLENVKLILNNIERNINCEEMFSNLNDNKVDLTSAELIKGLILTKTARENNSLGRDTTYKEILEIRAVMGRQWDYLSHWANRIDIKVFFFSNISNVLDELLLLLALKNGFIQSKDRADKNEVFNFFQSQIKKGHKSTGTYFEELKELRAILNEWYSDLEIYNTLGYVFFAKQKEKTTIRDFLGHLRNSKSEVKGQLNSEAIKLFSVNIPDLDFQNANDKNQIHNVLLALSVFAEDRKFNFTAFNLEGLWSLEHIFPQKPEDLSNLLDNKDIELFRTLCGERLNGFDGIRDRIKDLLDIDSPETVYKSLVTKLKLKQCELSPDEKIILYRLIKSDRLNSIGNLALLTKSDNSALGNGTFDKKRYNIVKRISHGSFVPKHTYDIFSKLISEKMTPDLSAWTETDMKVHEKWIIDKIGTLKSLKL